MDAAGALDVLRSELGSDLRVFVVVDEDRVDVTYVRPDVDRALDGQTVAGSHESHLRDIAAAMLTPGGTAAVRYTPDAIVVGLPAPDGDCTGYLISLEHSAADEVDDFIDTLLQEGATIMQSTASGPTEHTGNGSSVQLND